MHKKLELAARLSPYTRPQPAAKPMPDWDDFRVLMAVIQMGSFNRAADALGLTQPTVSRRIAGLEALIGVRIVDRDCTGAVLTLEGRRIFEELNIAHNALTRAINRTQAHQQKDVVKLLMADGLAAHWVTHFLPGLYRDYPTLELRILTANSTDQNTYHDLAIHFVPPTDPDMVATRLGTLHFIPYASVAYIAEYGRPALLTDFAKHRLLDCVLHLIDNGAWIKQLPELVAQDRTQLLTNSGAVLTEAVRKGAGIALLATYGSVFDADLVAIEAELHVEAPFWLCHNQDIRAKRPVQIAARFLRHIFDRKMPWFADHYVAPARFPKVTPDGVMRNFFKPSSVEPRIVTGSAMTKKIALSR
jgi:molybdate transport repressor ModE-like protein